MTDREKLVRLLSECRSCMTIEDIADKLISNGVTVDKDTNVPTKMKLIKTIVKRRDYADKFDKEVNSELSSGWKLVRRYIDSGMYGDNASTVFYPVFVAELELECNSTNGESVNNCARPLEEWHEDYGDVLWWKFPIEEPPYVGSPLDANWPDYHTHWTPFAVPEPPKEE